jgi:hypothetical protein
MACLIKPAANSRITAGRRICRSALKLLSNLAAVPLLTLAACGSQVEPTRFALRPTGVPPAPDAAELSESRQAVAVHENPPQVVLLVPPEDLLDVHAAEYPVEVAWQSAPEKKFVVRLRLDDGPFRILPRLPARFRLSDLGDTGSGDHTIVAYLTDEDGNMVLLPEGRVAGAVARFSIVPWEAR